jgi:quercetin dioxygenase-like cupin family protein
VPAGHFAKAASVSAKTVNGPVPFNYCACARSWDWWTLAAIPDSRPALLSKLERGKLFPTLPTLLRISMVFSIGLEHFFAQDRGTHLLAIVRKRERKRFPDRPGDKEPSYFFESLDFPVKDPKLNAFIADFCPASDKKLRPHLHAGVEFIYVLRGSLHLRVQDEDHTLNGGDSIYFDSSVLHGYRRSGRKPCAAIVITSS